MARRKSAAGADPAAPARKPAAAPAPPARRGWGAVMACSKRKTFHDNSISSAHAARQAIGIPLPSLSLCQLMGSNGLPIGRFYRIIGEAGSGKSTFAAEIMRWVLLHEGMAHYVENEAKDISEVRNAVWEHRPEWVGDADLDFAEQELMAKIDQTASAEEWQMEVIRAWEALNNRNEGFTRSTELEVRSKQKAALKARLADPKKRADLEYWRYPYITCVDSLTSSATEGTIEKTQDRGAVVQDFARLASNLSVLMQNLPHCLGGTSLIFLGVSHDKPTKDKFGNDVPNPPGGKAPKYQESCQFQMMPLGSAKDAAGGREKRRSVALVTNKNSLGGNDGYVHTELVYTRDELGRLRVYFDWGASTTSMFRKLVKDADSGKVTKGALRAVLDVMDFHEIKSSARYWSERLGIPEDSALPASEFGARIDRDHALRRELYPHFNVQERPIFRPGVPLDVQVREAVDPTTLEDRYDVRVFEPADPAGGDEDAA